MPPFKYLIVPLSTTKLSIIQCQSFIQKILHKIDSWTSKLLIYVGKVQLINSVLFGMPTYWCQIFLTPNKFSNSFRHCVELFCGQAPLGRQEGTYCLGNTLSPKGSWRNELDLYYHLKAICKLL